MHLVIYHAVFAGLLTINDLVLSTSTDLVGGHLSFILDEIKDQHYVNIYDSMP